MQVTLEKPLRFCKFTGYQCFWISAACNYLNKPLLFKCKLPSESVYLVYLISIRVEDTLQPYLCLQYADMTLFLQDRIEIKRAWQWSRKICIHLRGFVSWLHWLQKFHNLKLNCDINSQFCEKSLNSPLMRNCFRVATWLYLPCTISIVCFAHMSHDAKQ